MSEAIRSFTAAIEKMYQSFVMRDLLGFVLPGLIFLLSLWFLVGNPAQFFYCNSSTNRFGCVMIGLGTMLTVWQVFILLGVSYLAGWVLQCVHHSIADSLFQLMQGDKNGTVKPVETQAKDTEKSAESREGGYKKIFVRLRSTLSWPVMGIRFYVTEIRNGTQNAITTSLITKGALAPDIALKRVRGEKALRRLQESYPYTERLSALMLMTGNTAIASIPLLFAVRTVFGWWTLGGGIVCLLMYLEYWRIFCARNLRHELAVEAACQENENILEVSAVETVPTRPIWETIAEIGAQLRKSRERRVR
jgi:hypothetical protein